MAHVVLVIGPPGSGKTAYVEQRMRRGDLVIDVDTLFMALSGQRMYDKPPNLLKTVWAARDAAVRQMLRDKEVVHAWVISSVARPTDVERLRKSLGAELVVLDNVTASECKRRMQNDSRRRNVEQLFPVVDRWFTQRREEG